MEELLTSFLSSIQEESKLLSRMNKINSQLREALIGRKETDLFEKIKESKEVARLIAESDKRRERLWREVQEVFKLEGTSFYAKLQHLSQEKEEIKSLITQAYQELKMNHLELKNSTTSLEVYTETALDITGTLLEEVRTQESDTYSSHGSRNNKQNIETRALLIDKEL